MQQFDAAWQMLKLVHLHLSSLFCSFVVCLTCQPSSQVTTFDIAEFHAMTTDPVWMAKYAKATIAFLEDMDE
jgi:hypothetical protein